ncbi:MAG: DNA-binding protein [Rhodococcus sp.]|nr:DNA-binding protein [Rhodococcus sp. (in: high G+C Gram-positive bacteria)]
METQSLSRKAAAQIAGVDVRTLDKGIEDGTIPSIVVGRRILIPRAPFLALFGAANE